MKITLPALLLALAGPPTATAAESPVVLELFTSQGCSSCPPADALLQDLARRPGVLALSFHVDYWDNAGWRDPFSLPGSTDRQRDYAGALGGGTYTPELVVNGKLGLVGSRRDAVMGAVQTAQTDVKPVTVAVQNDGGGTMQITLTGRLSGAATLWLVSYAPAAVTAVRGGENSGRSLTSINNVTAIADLGPVTALPVRIAAPSGAHFALLVQGADKAIQGSYDSH